MKKQLIINTLFFEVHTEDYDPFLDGEEGFFKEDLEDRLEIQPPKEPEGSPSWRVQVEYTNHTEQDMCSYNDDLSDRPEELYLSLLEYFEPEEEEWFGVLRDNIQKN